MSADNKTEGNNTITFYTNIFLGKVKWQPLTQASITNKFVYGAFLGEGALMVLGNAVLVLVILAYKPLRRKEMFIMAGLAMGDMLYVPVAALLSAFLADQKPTVPAICISTQVGPWWFASYQPTIQMSCGILSVMIYILTWHFYRRQLLHMPQSVQNQQMERQRKLTRTVGITVLFTFFCYVLPHGMIFFFNTLQASKHLAGLMSPYGWVMSNANSIVNIFIMAVHNNDVRRIIKAWIRCKKPQFAGGHTVSQIHPMENRLNPKNRFRSSQKPGSTIKDNGSKTGSHLFQGRQGSTLQLVGQPGEQAGDTAQLEGQSAKPRSSASLYPLGTESLRARLSASYAMSEAHEEEWEKK